jgi:hypothetical protein
VSPTAGLRPAGNTGGVEPVNMLTVDRFDEYRSRNTAYGLGRSNEPLRIMPDESVLLAALNTGAAEVSCHLVRTLIERFRSRR